MPGMGGKKRERVLTTGWARVCEFLKTEFDSPSERQPDKVYRARQQTGLNCEGWVIKQKMDSVSKKEQALCEDDGASISPGFFLRILSGINQSLLQEYTEISPLKEARHDHSIQSPLPTHHAHPTATCGFFPAVTSRAGNLPIHLQIYVHPPGRTRAV